MTGLGLVTPLGTGVEKSWQALCAGVSGVRRISRFDVSEFPCQIAAEVTDFEPGHFIDGKEIKKMDAFIQYALAASAMAVKDAALDITPQDAGRVGVFVGSGIGGLGSIERWHDVLREKGPRRVSPFFIPMSIINLAAGQIAIRHGAKGPNTSVVSACATGNSCIGEASRLIRSGEADAMIAGGTEAAVTPLCVAGFAAARALSTRNEDPPHASRPFDKDRDGFVLGEGAGILVLEEWERAVQRGARIYGEVAGYANTADAYHITAPPEEGTEAARCITLALQDAGVTPEQIDYINAHATSTMADAIETRAIKTALGKAAYTLPISATKSMTGHLLGAAGGVEAIFCMLAIRDGMLPPTINLDHPDPACDLDYVPHVARKKQVRVALSNAFGFGGANTSLIFKAQDF